MQISIVCFLHKENNETNNVFKCFNNFKLTTNNRGRAFLPINISKTIIENSTEHLNSKEILIIYNFSRDLKSGISKYKTFSYTHTHKKYLFGEGVGGGNRLKMDEKYF